MAVQILTHDDDALVEIKVSGKLVKEDYASFVPEFERLIRQHGKLRVLFEMSDFHGWELSALWEDLKFDLKHFHDIERLAMVGDKKWEKGMSVFCKPFTTADVKYFDAEDRAAAMVWLGGKTASAGTA